MDFLLFLPFLFLILIAAGRMWAIRMENTYSTNYLRSLASTSTKAIPSQAIIDSIVLSEGKFSFDEDALPAELSLDTEVEGATAIYSVSYVKVTKCFNKIIGKGDLVLRVTRLTEGTEVKSSVTKHRVLTVGRKLQLA